MAADVAGLDAHLWFVGQLPREDTERAVRGSACGCFLIRERDTQPGFVICVNDGRGGTLQYQVQLTDLGLLLFAGREFATLHDVVESLRANPPLGPDSA